MTIQITIHNKPSRSWTTDIPYNSASDVRKAVCRRFHGHTGRLRVRPTATPSLYDIYNGPRKIGTANVL